MRVDGGQLKIIFEGKIGWKELWILLGYKNTAMIKNGNY